MARRKRDFSETEAEARPETRELVECFTEEIETGAKLPAEPGSRGMEPALFEDLLASVREAGALLRDKRASDVTDAVEAMTQVITSNGHLSPRRATDEAFEALTGVEAGALWDWVLGKDELPRVVGARRLRDHLAALLGCRPAEAGALLGVSDSRLRRDDELSGGMLDQAYAILGAYVCVASAIGPLSASSWFTEPHPSLGGQLPWRLLGTQIGRDALVELVDALLDGNHV